MTTISKRRLAPIGLVLLAVLLSVLPGCRKGSRTLGRVSVSDKIGRLCAKVDNSLECARAIETWQLNHAAPNVRRQRSTLSIRVGDGHEVQLTDKAGSDDEVLYYNYIEYVPALSAHLVHAQPYEGEWYVLVDGKTGKEVEIPAVPVLSPDKKRFATVRSDIGGGDLVEVWRVDAGQLSREWRYQPAGWEPSAVRWRGSDEIAVARFDADEGRKAKEQRFKLTAGGWKPA